MADEAQIRRWLEAKEDERLEFKTAERQYDRRKLGAYCIALANEGGGHIVLGISPELPRHVVGTQAFPDPGDIKQWLLHETQMRIDIDEVWVEGKRVLSFEVPSRPTGRPLDWKGKYLMRCGESLEPMTAEQLERIFAEKMVDYSAEECPSVALGELDPRAVSELRQTWRRKSGNDELSRISDRQLLSQADLVRDGRITVAALALLGTRHALSKHLPQAEIIFEYRSGEASIAHEQRVEFREGFLLVQDRLWKLIDRWNPTEHYQNGFFVWDIRGFKEAVVREAILNAVTHRDYRRQDPILIRLYPHRLEVVSPGGFPEGITTENILYNHRARNRCIAEVLQRCAPGEERSGQGVRRMFEESIKEGKDRPDFQGTDDYRVSLALCGRVRYPEFLRFLERVGQETLKTFATEDLLLLDCLREGEALPDRLKPRVPRLLDLGAIERVGRGRGTRYILSKRLYAMTGKRGAYTREKGLDRETNKELILRHLYEHGTASMRDLLQVLPHLSRGQIQPLLQELRRRGRIQLIGRKRGSKWVLAQG